MSWPVFARRQSARRLFKAACLGISTAALGLALTLLPVAALDEELGLPALFALRGTRSPPPSLLIVSIDGESAEELDLPARVDKWPRSLHGRLVERLSQAGAAVIAFDIIFDEPQSAKEDAMFATAIARAGNVVLAASLRQRTLLVPEAGKGAPAELIVEQLHPPIARLADSAAGVAPFPLPKVPVTLRQYWKFKQGAGDVPTLPVVVTHVLARDVQQEFLGLATTLNSAGVGRIALDPDAALPERRVERFARAVRTLLATESGAAERLVDTVRGDRGPSPDDAIGRSKLLTLIRMHDGDTDYLNLYGPGGTIPSIPYWRILMGDPPSASLDLKGRIVFVGLSGRLRPERKDDFYTDFGTMSGVEIAATAVGNLLESMPVRPLPPVARLAIVTLWGLFLGGVCVVSSAGVAAAFLLVAALAYLGAAVHGFASSGAWYPLFQPLLIQAPFAFFGGLVWKYADTEREREAVRFAFSQFLPRDEVDRIVRDVKGVGKSSRVVYGACLATDADQYTALAEHVEPLELLHLMNEYYEVVFEPVRRHGGIVSDVKGDAALAIWATAQPDADPRRRACLAACEVDRAVERFNRVLGRRTSGELALPTRIGLHAGRMSLGNVGAIDHFEFRAVGDIVNTATRIQGLNKSLGTRILASGETLESLDPFLTREVGSFLLVGKSAPIVLHEVLGRADEAAPAQRTLCEIFTRALRAYRAGMFDEAILGFEQVLMSHGGDGPSRFYLGLCERGKGGLVEGEPWTGVVRMNVK
jgi:adenylate cyclase